MGMLCNKQKNMSAPNATKHARSSGRQKWKNANKGRNATRTKVMKSFPKNIKITQVGNGNT